MAQDPVNTVRLNAWVDRMRAGDRAAADELCRGACDRLERLARKMLGRFPEARRCADTGDVLQSALIRLLRALGEVRPASTREFFGLAAEQMRRELLDLVRRLRGPLAAERPAAGSQRDGSAPAGLDPQDQQDSADDLDRWAAFHEGVARLPAEEREVIGLVFYHGWTQLQVAELFGVTDRTVRRWWESAMLRLRRGSGD